MKKSILVLGLVLAAVVYQMTPAPKEAGKGEVKPVVAKVTETRPAPPAVAPAPKPPVAPVVAQADTGNPGFTALNSAPAREERVVNGVQTVQDMYRHPQADRQLRKQHVQAMRALIPKAE